MQYQGGKARIGKQLAQIMAPALKAGTGYYAEPFVGAAGVARHVAPHAVAMTLGDASEDLVLMWQALAAGWCPPFDVSEDEYRALKDAPPSALRAFAGYGCSFGAKWFGGYARDVRKKEPFATAQARELPKRITDIQKCPRVSFHNRGYEDTEIHLGQLVYCDPPYADTLGYSRVGAFDNSRFWEVMERWDEQHAFVFVSEFTAPDGWVPVWAKPQDGSMRGSKRAMDKVDQLFCKPVVAQILGLTVCETTHGL